MALFNIFSDPDLKARQDILDAQWKSLHALQQGCDDLPSSSWVEFINDFRSWQEFYESGSDWSQNSKHATDTYQIKLQEWSKRMGEAGCRGSVGSVGGVDVVSPGDSGIPFVKEPPPDTAGLFDEVLDGVTHARDELLSPIATVGWVAVGLAVLIIIGIVWIATKGSISGYGVSAGGGK